MFVSEADDRLVVEPVPSLEELGEIHAGEDRARGEILEAVRVRKTDGV